MPEMSVHVLARDVVGARWYPYSKRAFDCSFSLVALVLLFPLLLLITALIKLTSDGPALYKGSRIGLDRREFACWKFRSMFIDADKRLEEILRKDQNLREEWQTFFKLKEDPRLTPLGKFLRKTSLDELPQLWNIVKGDLSLVGPRPFLPKELPAIREVLHRYRTPQPDSTKQHAQNLIERDLDLLFSCRPGLTGIWQTSGRSDVSFADRILLDLPYAQRSSPSLDLLIFCKTLPVFFVRKGAC